MSELTVSPRTSPAALRSARGLVPLLTVAFVASGASGLIFELVWLYRAALLVGSSVWATSLVLSSFMGGLAIGGVVAGRLGARRSHPLRLYGWAELLVAASGIALTYGLGALSTSLAPLTASYLDTRWLVNLVRLGATFVLLLVPTTAMGTTLPLLSAALHRDDRPFGSALGWLYGVNTIGAVLGVLALELVLMGSLGVVGSAWAAGALSAGAAAAALWAARQLPAAAPPPAEAPRADVRRPPSRLLLAAALMGAALMALEVIWFRFLSMFIVASTLAASLLLAGVLATIAAGGLLASAWLERRPEADEHVPLLISAAAATSVLSYVVFQFLTADVWAAEWQRIVWATLVLTGPTSLISGAAFVLLGAALKRRTGADAHQATGWLTAMNTTGGLVGPLVAGFVLLPALGMERSLFALAVTYVIVAAVAVWEFGVPRSRHARATAMAVALATLLAVTLFPFGLMARTYFDHATREYTSDGSSIVATREGLSETIQLLGQRWLGKPLYFRLVTNGFSMSGTHVTGKRYMRYFAYLPLMLRDSPLRHALVICYGAGVTTEAVTSISSLQSIDVAEISPDIIAMSPVIHGISADPLRDPRLRLHLEDGRYFLQATRERFDLITAEPPPPLTPGTVNLYTSEHFQLIYDRLADGGVATYWLPVARRGEYDVRSIIAAFCDVFDDCSLWNGTVFDWMLVGTRQLKGPVAAATFAAPWADARVLPRLREAGFETPQQIGATFLADRDGLRQLVGDTAPLTDNYPQRLRPAPGRLSIVAAPTPADLAAGAFVGAVVDAAKTQAAFARSRFIRAHWPPALVAESLPFFEVQRALNDVMREGAAPLAHIEDIHRLLTGTALRRAPLWLLGSDDPQQEAADPDHDASGLSDYVIGIRALVARQYEPAATAFAEAQHRGLRLPTLRPLLAYALCLSGHRDLASELARQAPPGGDDERHFWDWLRTTYGLARVP